MPSREKIRMMTDLAIFEKENRDTVFRVNSYYKYDYIVGNCLSAFFRYTVCCAAFLAVYIIFRADVFLYNINLKGIGETLRLIGGYYLKGLAVYLVIAFIVYTVRYRKARRGMHLYTLKLKRLNRRLGGRER